jgi:hypothetical protein
MKITVKNGDLTKDTIESLNKLIALKIPATIAFKLVFVIERLNEIISVKMTTEKSLVERFAQKNADGSFTKGKDADGKELDGFVIIDPAAFETEFNNLAAIETILEFDQIKFEDLSLNELSTISEIAKIKFLFEKPV